MTVRRPQSIGFFLAVIFAALCLTPAGAFASCTTPTGNPGDIFYSSNTSVMYYCNGASWVSLNGAPAVSFGTLTSPDFCAATSGTAIACTTPSTGSGNVVLSASPTLTGTVAGANSTWSGSVAIGTTTTSGALNVSGTVTATTFSGSGASLTSIGTTNLSAITGSASSTTFLAGNGTWETVSSGGGVTGSGFTTGDFCTASGSSGIVCSTAQIGLTSQVTGVLPIANGGTNANTQTSSGVAYFNGTSITSGTGFVYSGTNVGIGTATAAQPLAVFGNIDIGTSTNYSGLLSEIPNSSTATVVNKLAKLNGANAVTVGTTGDTDGMIGVVVGGAGTSGNAQIAIHGNAGCIFDATPTAVGDFVTISSSTAGDCHDTGTKTRTGITSQIIGEVLSTSAISGSIYPVAIAINGSSGGVPAGTTGQVQYNSGSSTFAASSNFTYLSANNQLVVGTGAATPVGTAGTFSGVVMNIIPQAVVPTVVTSGATFNSAATGEMAYYSTANAISGTPDLYVSGANIGLGTSTPTNLLSLTGQNPQIFWMERDYTAGTAGQSLTVQAGGAASGGSNLNGGNLVLSSGISTGTGTSSIQFQTFPGTAGTTTDNTVQTRMTITGGGNVGIGTTGPKTNLDVEGNGSANGYPATFYEPNLASGNYGYISTGISNTTSNAANFGYLDTATPDAAIWVWGDNPAIGTGLYVQKGGNVGIGTTGPNEPLEVVGSGGIAFSNNVASYGYGQLYDDTWTHLAADNTNAQVMALSSPNGIYLRPTVNGTSVTYFNTAAANSYINATGGNVGIGTASPGAPLHVDMGSSAWGMFVGKSTTPQGGNLLELNAPSGYVNYIFQILKNNSTLFYVDPNGNEYAVSNNTISDARLKKDITPIQWSWDKLALIKGVNFYWRDPEKGQSQQIGVIAQDVEKAFPEAVTVDQKGLKSVNYSGLIAPLIEAVKQLKADNDNLRAANDNQAAEIKALRADIEQLKSARH